MHSQFRQNWIDFQTFCFCFASQGGNTSIMSDISLSLKYWTFGDSELEVTSQSNTVIRQIQQRQAANIEVEGDK